MGEEEYTGRMSVDRNGKIELNAEDGMGRWDVNRYEFTVTFSSATKMEWTYDWKGIHSNNGDKHEDNRMAKAIFIRQ